MNNDFLKDQFTLSNGVKINKLGLGTWLINNSDSAEAVRQSVKLGYRHIDTTQAYMNEQGVGEGIHSCGIKREEIFVTTKLDAFIKDYKNAIFAIDNSLQTLGLDYIDLLIIHSPQPWTKFNEKERYFEGNLAAWSALEKAYKEGKLRAIGVSNFQEDDLNNIINNSSTIPMVNQILAHVSNMPWNVINYCNQKNILVEAYSPMGHGEMMKNEILSKIASQYNVSIAQLCIRYCLQHNILPLPKTANPAHMKNNAELNFTISKEDMNILDNLEQMKNYGDASIFPVYGGKMDDQGNLTAGSFRK